jgi:excisionase family DNA binding protein
VSIKVMSKSYLTPNQVAELLMVSPTAVRQWAEKGDLHALTTPGGHRRFLPSDVESFARNKGLTLNLGNDDILRVLIVDDDAQLTRYLVKFLEGFHDKVAVDTTSDGFLAGLKISEFDPHVILLDLMMPGVNGFDVCRVLKMDPKTRGIRVIAMTGFPSKENVEKILAAGAEVCLSKPIDENVLLEHLGLIEEAINT